MFSMGGSGDSILKIGSRNTEACKRALASLGIPVISEDTGGSWGRTIVLFSDSGILEVRSIGRTKTQI